MRAGAPDLSALELPAIEADALDWQLERSFRMADRDERYALISGAVFLWLCSVSVLANLSVASTFHVNFFWIDFDVVNGVWPRLAVFLASFVALSGYFLFTNLAQMNRRSLLFFYTEGSPKVVALLHHAKWIKANQPWIYRAFPVVGFLMILAISALFISALVTLIASFQVSESIAAVNAVTYRG